MTDTDKIGTVVGRYKITGIIGSGAMADVYETYDPEINRSAALKLLKEDRLVDKEYLNRFLTEAKAAGALTHPNIVTVYDVGKVEETPYIMMELLEGTTLGDKLKNDDRIPIKTLIEISMQIASALDYAHNMGVVHRDIKPDNIIFNEQQSSIKIADFGIAHLADSSEQEKTQAGAILGTPRYMSPEQAKGEAIDGRSDLFSLGVILYELLTGHKAFSADSITTLIHQIVQKDPTPIRQYYPEAPAGLQSIIGKLLHKKPGKRFQSGAELYNALEKELRALRDDEDAKGYLPMQIKWTAAIGAIVAVVMAASVMVVFQVQSRVLTNQVIDSGVSLARFIAAETAVPVLGEDWIGLEALTDEATKRRSFAYLNIIDHDGVVRSATDKTLLGQPWAPLKGEKITVSDIGISVTRATTYSQEKVFAFTTPIQFNTIDIGRIDVGISQAQLEEVQSVTRRTMASLALSIILAMLIIIYFFNKLVAKNLKVIQYAIEDFTEGNHSARISRPWKNEFGGVAAAFNAMADTIHHDPDKNPRTDLPDSQNTSDSYRHSNDSAKSESSCEMELDSSSDYTIIETGVDEPD